MAIILPEKDEDALNIVAISVMITFFVSILSLIIIFFFGNFLASLLNSPEIADYLMLIPVTVFAIGIYTTFNLWLNRKGHYKTISVGKITRSSFSSFFSIGFGLALFKAGGLIISDTIGQSVAGFLMLLKSLRYDGHKISAVSRRSMIRVAKRYSQFPKFNIISGLFEKTSGQLPVILLTSFFGASITGFFSLSQMIIAAPGALIGSSVGDVFRQQASQEFQEKGNCRNTFLNLLKFLFSLAVIPFSVVLIFAPFLFSFVYGEEWRIAGEYAQIMTVMFFLSFIVSPLSNMFIIAEKQKIDLIIQIFLICLVSLSFIVGYNIFNKPKIAILLYSIIYCFKYFAELYLSYQFSKGVQGSLHKSLN